MPDFGRSFSASNIRYYQHQDLERLNQLWPVIQPNSNYSQRAALASHARPRTVASPYIAPRGNRSPSSYQPLPHGTLHRSIQARPSTVGPNQFSAIRRKTSSIVLDQPYDALGSIGVAGKVGEGQEKLLDYRAAPGNTAGWADKYNYHPPAMGSQGLPRGKYDTTANLIHNQNGFTHADSLSHAIFNNPAERPRSSLSIAGMKTGITPEYIYQKSRVQEIAFNPQRDPMRTTMTRPTTSVSDGKEVRKGGFVRSALGYGVFHRNYDALLAHHYKQDGAYGNHMNRAVDHLDDYDDHDVQYDTVYSETHTLGNSTGQF